MSIVRRREKAAGVPSDDIAFLKSHVASCRRCTADSAVIRGVLSGQNGASSDELSDRRRADAVVRLASEMDREEEERAVRFTPGRALPIVAIAAAAAVLVGLYIAFSESPVSKPPQDRTTASASETPSPEAEAPGETALVPTQRSSPSAAAPEPSPSIRTAARNRSVLLPAGIRILVQPDSEVEVRRSDPSAVTVALGRGELLASVNPDRTGPPFAVETPLGKVTVKGTVFTVATDGAEDRVAVLRGEVVVTGADGAEGLVAAGERLSFSDNRRLPLEDDVRAAMARDATLLAAADERPGDFVDWRWPGERISNAARKNASEPTKPAYSSASARPTVRELLLDIRTLRLGKQWREAVETYQRLIDEYPASQEAEAALVALGDIQLNKLAQPEMALARFDRYIRQGSATLMEEALVGKAAALRKLGRLREERAVLEQFVSRFPKSVHFTVVQGRLGTLNAIGSPR